MIKLLTTTMMILGVATTVMAAPREITITYEWEESIGWDPIANEYATQTVVEEEIWVDQGDDTWKSEQVPDYTATTTELLSEKASHEYLSIHDPDPYNSTEVTWGEIEDATGIDAINGQKGGEYVITVETSKTKWGYANYIDPISGESKEVYDDGEGWFTYDETYTYETPVSEEIQALITFDEEWHQPYAAPTSEQMTVVIESTGDYLKYGNDYEPKSTGDLDAAIQLRATLAELEVLKTELQAAIAAANANIAVQIASLADQWADDKVISRQISDGIIKSINEINNDSTQVWTNADAIADHEGRISSNTTRIENLEDRVTNVEDRVARLENPSVQNDDSKAVKYARKMWLDAKIAKQGNDPVYYTTSNRVTVDLRALSFYDPQHGLAVTEEYRKEMGFVSVWVGK